MPRHALGRAFYAIHLRIRFKTGHAQADDILRQELAAFLARTVQSSECSQLRLALRCDTI